MNETSLKTPDKLKRAPDDSDGQIEIADIGTDQMGSSDEEDEGIITVEKVTPTLKPVGATPPIIKTPRVRPKMDRVEPSEFETIDKVKPSIAPSPECEVVEMQRTRHVVCEIVSETPLEIHRVSQVDMAVKSKPSVRKIPDVDIELMPEPPKVVEPKPSLDVFGDIGVDEGDWITNGSTGLPSDAQLFYIHGKEGAGFDVFKGLLTLEIMDRGRRPNPQEISFSTKKARNIKDISDDKDDYYRLIWVENSQIQDMRVPEIASEISKASNKGFLRYVVFANQTETLTTDFGELEDVFAKHGSFSEIRLMRDPRDELSEVGVVFAKILQINRRDISIQEMFSGFNKPTTIDSLWNWMWHEKNSALKTLKNEYASDPNIRQYLPPSSKLDNESDEHFVMKQLAVKEILDMGKGKWSIKELHGAGKDYESEWKEDDVKRERYPQEISIESTKFRIDKKNDGTPVKRPDITFRTEKGNYIWIEVETCKNSKNPLDAVMDKLRPLTEVEESERPDELWVVFPYRKYFLYGTKRFEKDVYSFFAGFRQKNNNIDKFKPRIFFVDMYNEKLMELELGS